ncbi:phosphoglycolate phosphatase [Pantoea sp. AG1095]|uniref:HAD family hydrolase n=1 Tax=Pantoea sp. AG1095 TaxID=2184004 RepID=UPI000D946FD6|nr:HAD-IA family hydrolase [Pantoea sp. AG1095]PYG47227.1 phosphoglycolate phosphatase [Pantoea sp. AG1095]
MKKSVLITDLDNTLFDWFSVWYHSFNSMLEKASEISGICKLDLINQIKPIHQKYGTAEYSFILESIPSLQEKYGSRESINSAMDEAIHAFRSARKKHLCLYPTVMDTLKDLKSRGCYIVAYTESKAYYSNFRLTRLQLDGLIDVLFSPEDHAIPEGEVKQEKYKLIHTKQEYTPADETKPNPQLLLDIVKSIGAMPDDCVYIGDSEMKDIEMAQKAKITDVFASYGTGHFQENKKGYDLLRAVTHWTDADVERERLIKESSSGAKPTYTAHQFSDILKFFDFIAFQGKNK